MMPEWLMLVLGRVYGNLSPAIRPFAKRVFDWGALQVQAVIQRRSVVKTVRVEFLDFEIADLAQRAVLGPGHQEVLVQAEYSCVSPGTERAVLCGLPGARRPFPYVPGYSVVGRVAAVGRMGPWQKGQRVAGRMAHASLGVLSPASLFAVPDGVAADDAAWIELGIIVLQGIRKGRIRPGERVAVIGQGVIGQLAVRLARVAGAGQVVAVAASRRRAAMALGPKAADEFVASTESPAVVKAISADITVEAVGTTEAILLAIEATRPGGRVVLLGSSRDLGRNLAWWTLAQVRNVTVIGAHIGALPRTDSSFGMSPYHREGQLFLNLLAAGRLKVADLVTWRAVPTECNRVYEVLAEGGGNHVGILFDWTQLVPATSGGQPVVWFSRR